MPSDSIRNRFIASLDPGERKRLEAIAEPVTLHLKDVLVQQDAPVDYVYFPTSSAISLLTVMNDGGSIEAALIGRDGMVGFCTLLGAESMPWQAVVQMEGDALRVPRGKLLEDRSLTRTLSTLAAAYQTGVLWQATLSIACNRFHPIAQRCARWLLMINDRSDSDTIEMTQEFLAEMLGVRRQSVSEVLGNLERQGLIERSRQRHIRLANRSGLEALTCECYWRMFLPQDLPNEAS